MKENNTFKDDIQKAERAILIYSWLGVASAFAIMGYSFWGMM